MSVASSYSHYSYFHLWLFTLELKLTSLTISLYPSNNRWALAFLYNKYVRACVCMMKSAFKYYIFLLIYYWMLTYIRIRSLFCSEIKSHWLCNYCNVILLAHSMIFAWLQRVNEYLSSAKVNFYKFEKFK